MERGVFRRGMTLYGALYTFFLNIGVQCMLFPPWPRRIGADDGRLAMTHQAVLQSSVSSQTSDQAGLPGLGQTFSNKH